LIDTFIGSKTVPPENANYS